MNLPPRTRYCSEVDCSEAAARGTHVRYHKITYEGYRQVVSAGAFFEGSERKWKLDQKREVVWPSHHEFEHHFYTEGPFAWHSEIPIIEHDSIWAFYEYIGYDYKKKRYLK